MTQTEHEGDRIIPVDYPDYCPDEIGNDITDDQMAERIAAELNYYEGDEDLEENVKEWIKNGKELEIDSLSDLCNLQEKLNHLIRCWKRHGKAAYIIREGEGLYEKNRDELSDDERWEISEAEFELQCVYDDVCNYICGIAAEINRKRRFERDDSSK